MPAVRAGSRPRALPLPDLVGQKRKLALAQGSDVNGAAKRAAKRDLEPARWVHVGKLPLTITADQVRAALAGISSAKRRGLRGFHGGVDRR